MGIQVECPNGHVFKVKDKYAGKKGLCPQCEGQVVVQVPAMPDKTESAFREAIIQEHRAAHAAPPTGSSSVFDDHPSTSSESDSGTSASLIGSSVIRHKIKCECGAHVPMWFAKCPSCGKFLEQ